MPSFVLEITSEITRYEDEPDKLQKYQCLGLLEYFQYDPTGDYLNPLLKGLRLIENRYEPIPAITLPDGTISIHSQSLSLDLRLTEGELRYYDPRTETKLFTHSEADQARRSAEAQLIRDRAIPRLAEMGLSAEQIAIALNLSINQVQQFTQ